MEELPSCMMSSKQGDIDTPCFLAYRPRSFDQQSWYLMYETRYLDVAYRFDDDSGIIILLRSTAPRPTAKQYGAKAVGS